MISRSVWGPIRRTDYAAIRERALQLAQRLTRAGIRQGDPWSRWPGTPCAASKAWYGITGIGAVYHTVKPRLFEQELPWILNHAESRLLLTGLSRVPLLEKIAQDVPHDGAVLDEEGYLDTGDIATTDPYGYMHIPDRAKDLIKFGGEWTSFVALETAAAGRPNVVEAAAIVMTHPQRGERRLLLVVPKPGAALACEAFLAILEGTLAKWWLPDEVALVGDLPHTATGKVDRKAPASSCATVSRPEHRPVRQAFLRGP